MKILSIDQSYTRTGFAINIHGKVAAYSVKLSPKLTRVARRAIITQELTMLLAQGPYDLITVEHIRFHREGKLNIKVALALMTLVSSIADVCHAHKSEIKSIDTRAWKAGVLGNASASKQDAVWYAKVMHKLDLDDDAADALCMSVYASSPGASLLAAE